MEPWPDCSVLQISDVVELTMELFDEFGRCRYKAAPSRPLERLPLPRWPLSDYAKSTCQRKAVSLWDATASKLDCVERWQADRELKQLVMDRSGEVSTLQERLAAVKAALRGL